MLGSRWPETDCSAQRSVRQRSEGSDGIVALALGALLSAPSLSLGSLVMETFYDMYDSLLDYGGVR